MKTRWIAAYGALLMAALPAGAQVPSTFNYQGRLLDGTNLVSGTRQFIVRLYTASSGGTLVYTETNASVAVVDGLYSFLVGDDASGLPAALTNAALYIELQVDTQTLSPRERLSAAAYSILAAGVQDGGVVSNMIAPGAVSGAHIAPDSITDAKIASTAAIRADKISGTALTQSTTFGGDLSGLYSNLQIGPNAVGNTEIAANAVGTSQIIDNQIRDADIWTGAAIQPNKINGTALTQLTAFAGDVAGTYLSLVIQNNTIATNHLQIGAVESRSILDGTIRDVDVSTTANIAGTKIVPGNSIQRGTVQLTPLSAGPFVVGQGDPDLNAFGIINTFTAAAPRSAVSITGAVGVVVSNLPGNIVRIAVPGLPLPSLDNVVWVATNGTPTGPGTIDRPFNLPQAGYDYAGTTFVGRVSAVVIASGRYFGNLVMSNGNVHVIGLGRPQLVGPLGVTAPAATVLVGRQRVEGLVIESRTSVQAPGAQVKFHNCRMQMGLDVFGNDVEVQHCFITDAAMPGPGPSPLTVGSGQSITNFGIYNSSVFFDGQAPTVDIRPNVAGCEIGWCEVVYTNSHLFFAAILDREVPVLPPLQPLHLITHNYIKGPKSEQGTPAIQDSGPQTLAVHQNTVWGDIGTGPPQYVGQNMVYGRVVSAQAGGVGAWTVDANGNTLFLGTPPLLPDIWDD